MHETMIERLAKASGDLPAAPAVVLKVLSLAQDPDSKVEDLERVIEVDPGLATRLLRVANSAYYRRSREVFAIHEAVLTLGFRTVLSLTLASSTKSVFDDRGDSRRWVRDTLWDHSISTAFVASELARQAGGVDPQLCFIAGLLHDIGKLVVMRNFPREFEEVLNATKAGDGHPLEIEERVLGFRHDELGAHLAREWELPDSLVTIIRHHHGFADAAELSREAAIVHLADHMTKRLGWNFACPPPAKYTELEATASLGMDGHTLEERTQEVQTNVAELKSIF